jgi:mannose-6-phosphate isomerase-like protein (cupin superfamily)
VERIVSPPSSRDLPVIARGEGLNAPLGRLGTLFKVRSQFVDGRLTIVEHTLPARRLAAPLHRHSREDELSIVLTGQLGALLGNDVVTAGPGSYVLKPRGQWHTVWNAGSDALQFVELIIPGGLEDYLERLSPMLNTAAPPSREVIARTASEYGMEFDFDSAADLRRRFDVTLEHWPA